MSIRLPCLPACTAAVVAIVAGILLSVTTRTPPKRTTLVADGGATAVMLSLQDGTMLRFPLVSFGLQVYESDEIAYNLTRTALELGYRNFVVDTEHQQAFAQAIVESGVARQDLFITGSVPSIDNMQNDEKATDVSFLQEDAYESTRRACHENLAAFAAGNIHTLDQILLDVPPGLSCNWIRGQWRALEEMVQANQIRTLAVSNFASWQLDCLLDDPKLKFKPVVNQKPFNVAYHPPDVIQENMKRGVMVQAWSPLGGSAHKFNETVMACCGDVGKQYGKSFAQVALRWITQKGAAITLRSTVREHFVEDLNIFDFELSSEDMALLDSLHEVG